MLLLLACLAMPVVALMIRLMIDAPFQREAVFRTALNGGYHALVGIGLGPGAALALVLTGKLVILNLALALFNLLPFGPLDGAWILRGFLPDRLVPKFDQYRPMMGIVLLVLVFLTDAIVTILMPVLKFLFNLMYPLARVILGA